MSFPEQPDPNLIGEDGKPKARRHYTNAVRNRLKNTMRVPMIPPNKNIIKINGVPYISIKDGEVVLRHYIFTNKKESEKEGVIIDSYIPKRVGARYFLNPLIVNEKWYDDLEYYEESIPIDRIMVANNELSTIIALEGENPQGWIKNRLSQLAKQYSDTMSKLKEYKGDFKHPEYLVFNYTTHQPISDTFSIPRRPDRTRIPLQK